MVKNILQIIFTSLICITMLSGCLFQNKIDDKPVLIENPVIQEQKPEAISNAENQANKEVVEDTEEKVIISINNYGRSNPFKPFHERSLMAGVSDLPSPPMYIPPSPEITNLMSVKVSGILYDPAGSSAIINVDDSDYLVHKGDLIFDYHIKDITVDKVVVKYGSNIYKAGIGEIIGEVNQDPVRGINKMFGGTQKVSSLPEIKLVTPTYRQPFE